MTIPLMAAVKQRLRPTTPTPSSTDQPLHCQGQPCEGGEKAMIGTIADLEYSEDYHEWAISQSLTAPDGAIVVQCTNCGGVVGTLDA